MPGRLVKLRKPLTAKQRRKAAEASARFRANNPDKWKAITKRSYRKHKIVRNENSRVYRKANRKDITMRMRPYLKSYCEIHRVKYNRARSRRAGLPEPTRDMPQLCECCGNPPGKKALALDHCHVTGKFRGWLCGLCNTGMGALGDNIPGLLRAVDYLTRNG